MLKMENGLEKNILDANFLEKFGIIGLGRLGIISARIANGFGMNVMATIFTIKM